MDSISSLSERPSITFLQISEHKKAALLILYRESKLMQEFPGKVQVCNLRKLFHQYCKIQEKKCSQNTANSLLSKYHR